MWAWPSTGIILDFPCCILMLGLLFGQDVSYVSRRRLTDEEDFDPNEVSLWRADIYHQIDGRHPLQA